MSQPDVSRGPTSGAEYAAGDESGADTQTNMESPENDRTSFYPLQGVARRDAARDRGRFVSSTNEFERFWSQVNLGHGARFVAIQRADGGGCWLWQGQLDDDGYGRFKTVPQPGTYRTVRAHRWAYQATYGPIPEDLTIDHLCGQRACVRPDHLEAVTHTENLRRRHARRRSQQPPANEGSDQ